MGLYFKKILIANRGDVAVRIAKTCDKLGVDYVFAVSEIDAKAPYVKGRQSICIGPSHPSDSYLASERLIQAAIQTGCSAIHPGWGFLSENPVFSMLAHQHGLTFIGPCAHIIHLMGQKTPAKKIMQKYGLDLIPGSEGAIPDVKQAEKITSNIGFPVLFKAVRGGGGRGMRIARSLDEVAHAYETAKREAITTFGNDEIYVEKLIESGRHIEIQILADNYGNVVHVGERDCTIQRNHQKLVEESPALVLSQQERERVLPIAVEAVKKLGYQGVGTLEFLLDGDRLRFLEMNTRLQVEHGVSEVRSGIDLVEQQLRVAAGQKLSIRQEDIVLRGHAIECRINAEDPNDGFKPSPGKLLKWSVPSIPGLRVDTHVQRDYVVPHNYDSLIAKIIVMSDSREQAINQMLEVLGNIEVEGVATTIPLHQAVLGSESFRKFEYDNRSIPGWNM